MRRHGERLRTPKECREKRFTLNQYLVLCSSFLAVASFTGSGLKPTKRKVQSSKHKVLSSRIKQTRPLLAGLDSKMLISELGCHSASRRAIEKTDLNQVGLDDFFD